LVVTVIFKI